MSCQGCEQAENRVALIFAALAACYGHEGDGDHAERAIDLLVNLRHFVEAQQGDFSELLRISEMHWEEERHGGGRHTEFGKY